MKRLAALTATIVVMVLFTGTTRASIDWVQDGVHANNNTDLLVGAPVIVTSGSYAFVAQYARVPNPPGADAVHVVVQKFDKCGQKLWGANGMVPDGGGSLPGGFAMITDGTGGVIVAWEQGDPSDIYAQRYDAAGNIQWAANGIPIVATADQESDPTLITDNAGGAFLFYESATGPPEIYAQRFDGNGTPLWAGTGVRVSTQTTSEFIKGAIEGTSGGAAASAIVAYRIDGLGSDYQYYVQKIDGAGNLIWGPDGTLLESASSGGIDITTNNVGGAWAAFEIADGASPGTRNVLALHVDFTGAIIDSYEAGNASLDDYQPQITYAGGDVHLYWSQVSSGDHDIRVTRIGSYVTHTIGTNPAADQIPKEAIHDGNRGSVLVFLDERNGNEDVYAIRYTPSFGWAWPALSYGIPVCIDAAEQASARVARSDTSPWNAGDFYFAWSDVRAAPNTRVYVQRVDGETGVWGHPEIKITAVPDRDGNDEGGWVTVEWIRSQLDGPLYPYDPPNPVVSYSIWRATDTLPVYPPDDICPDPASPGTSALDPCVTWTRVGVVAATEQETYALAVPTTRDAAPGDPALHYFAITAADELGEYYVSAPDSGASTDDIAPAPPDTATAMQVGNYIYLGWTASAAPDVAGYNIHRAQGLSRFVLYATTSGLDWTDTAPNYNQTMRYRITAVDDNGNEGVPTADMDVNAIASGAGDTPRIPATLLLTEAVPNPFSRTTSLRVGLAHSDDVSIDVYDVAGRVVHREQRRGLGPGWHVLAFSATLPSGVYFYRVRTSGETALRKIVVVR